MAIKVSGTTVIDDSRNLQNTVNVNATGNAYANTFIGDGSQLTNLPAGGSSTELVASGALSDGSLVVVNADGTVSVAGNVNTENTFGDSTIFYSGETRDLGAVFDSSSNKVIVAYRDVDNSSYGTAVVGTVSGTSISFGSPTVFNTGETNDVQLIHDTNQNKIVLVYEDDSSSNKGAAIVGTVSGTSISFGSQTFIGIDNIANEYIDATFDSNSNKVVVVATDWSNSRYGTAVVGTVSGTSISFGTPVVFASVATQWTVCTFDSNSNKVVVAYTDTDAGTSFPDSDYGTAIVGTVSGTSISFGSPTVFNAYSTDYISATFDSNSNKVVISYQDGGAAGSTKYGTSVVGTVSGTSISFGTPVVFNNARSDNIDSTFDTTSNKVIVVFADHSVLVGYRAKIIAGTVSGTSISFGSKAFYNTRTTGYPSEYVTVVHDSNSNKNIAFFVDNSDTDKPGIATIGTLSGTTFSAAPSNLTSTNFIGISDGAYANGATATIQLVGATDDAQSGLTTGSLHYVLANGSISTTAGSPSVVAGLALSSTELAIKAQ